MENIKVAREELSQAYMNQLMNDDEMNFAKYDFQSQRLSAEIKYETKKATCQLGAALLKTGVIAVGSLAAYMLGKVAGGEGLGVVLGVADAIVLAKTFNVEFNVSNMIDSFKSAREATLAYNDFKDQYDSYEGGISK